MMISIAKHDKNLVAKSLDVHIFAYRKESIMNCLTNKNYNHNAKKFIFRTTSKKRTGIII